MLDQSLITMFVLVCIGLAVGMLAFFAKAWMSTLNDTIKELSANVHEMTSAISVLKQEQVLHRYQLKQQGREIQRLQEMECTMPGCPSKQPSGPNNVPLHVHIREEDFNG